MRRTLFYSLAAGGFALASFLACTQAEMEADAVMPCPADAVSFGAAIGGAATRATDIAFEEGDRASIYAFNHDQGFGGKAYAENVAHRFTQGSFMPETPEGAAAPEAIVYPADGSSLAFHAIYPYREKVDGSFFFSVGADQSTEAAYKASDLLTAYVAPTTTLTAFPDGSDCHLFLLPAQTLTAGVSQLEVTPEGGEAQR